MSDEIPAFTLEFFGGPLAGKSIAPAGSSFRVGRTKTSKLQIKDPAVSEKHAEIAYRDGHWQIRDLGSSNGTVVNNAEVMERWTKLRNGDIIKFGTDSVATLQIDSLHADGLTVQQLLEAESKRLEEDIRGHTQQLVNGFTSVWEESKAELLAACDRLSS